MKLRPVPYEEFEIHRMSLKPIPFKKIWDEEKTIELRLYDEKRQKLRVNDRISFTNTENKEERMLVKIIALHIFDSFEELYKKLPLEKGGYSKDELDSASYHDMDKYYSPEEQQRYGVVGIEIEHTELCYEWD